MTDAGTTSASTSTTLASTTAAAPTSTSAGAATSSAPVDTGDLIGWETTTITVGDARLLVAVADDPGERGQGLMGIEQLGEIDGMLFVFPQEALGGFWMKDTLIPLDIAFFGDDGVLVDTLEMVPCTADPCHSYVPDEPFSWALETPAGTLDALTDGTMLALEE